MISTLSQINFFVKLGPSLDAQIAGTEKFNEAIARL
jgi:hypothetical protein